MTIFYFLQCNQNTFWMNITSPSNTPKRKKKRRTNSEFHFVCTYFAWFSNITFNCLIIALIVKSANIQFKYTYINQSDQYNSWVRICYCADVHEICVTKNSIRIGVWTYQINFEIKLNIISYWKTPYHVPVGHQLQHQDFHFHSHIKQVRNLACILIDIN